MYRSYSVSNMPTPIPYREKPKEEVKRECNPPSPKPPEKPSKGGLLENIKTDDIILIIVVLALILDDCDDKLLLAALGFIFLSDFF